MIKYQHYLPLGLFFLLILCFIPENLLASVILEPVNEYTLDNGARNARCVRIKNDYLFISARDQLLIYDISDPADPEYLNHLDLEGSQQKIIIDNEKLYVSNSDGIYLIDISSPANPAITSFYASEKTIKDFAVQGDFVYVAAYHGPGAGRIIAVDFTDPQNPITHVTLPTSFNTSSIYVAGNTAWAGGQNIVNSPSKEGLWTFDISNGIELLDHYKTSPYSRIFTIDQDNRIYTAYVSMSVFFSAHELDEMLPEPAVNVPLAKGGGGYDLQIKPGCIITCGSAFQIYSIEPDEDEPLFHKLAYVSADQFVGTLCSLDVSGNYVYTVTSNKLYIIDIGGLSLECHIDLKLPESNITVVQGETVDIEWKDYDPDANAAVALFLDTDTDHDNGHDRILSYLEIWEDPDGAADQFILETSSMPPGQYFVYAMMYKYNGESEPVFSYAPGKITVQTNLLLQDWTSLSNDKHTYTAKILRKSTDIDVTERILYSSSCGTLNDQDQIESVSIVDDNGNVLKANEGGIKMLGLMASNIVMKEAPDWYQYSNYHLLPSDFQTIHTFEDMSGNRYPIFSFLDLPDDDLRKIRDQSKCPLNNEGLDSFEQRKKLYKALISRMAYHLNEEAISDYFNEHPQEIAEIEKIVDKVKNSSESVTTILAAAKGLFEQMAGTGEIILGNSEAIDSKKLVGDHFDYIFDVYDSAMAGYDAIMPKIVVWLHMNIVTMNRLNLLHDAILSVDSDSMLYDKALVDAITEVRDDFYTKFIPYQEGDWLAVAEKMWEDYEEFQAEWSLELAKIWGEKIVSSSLGLNALQTYLILAPWKAGFSFWSDRDLLRLSILSGNVYKGLTNALENDLITANNSLDKTILLNTANQLRGISSYSAYHYTLEYLNSPLVENDHKK